MSEYIDKITDKDTGDSRIISPAAEDVRVDNENFDGRDLDEVLDEVAHAIDEAGSGDGTVTGVKVGSTTYEPTDGVVDLSTPIGNKVDKVTGKGLSSNDYTDTDKAKVDGLKTVATSGSYNDLTDKPTIPTVPTMDSQPTAGNTTHMVSSDGVASALNSLLQNLRIVNNEWYIGNTATGVSAQGPTGNVNISDAGDLVTILVNDLTTGGAGNILTAEMGKVLKIAVQTLIDSMGEYCFPNGRPTLSWEGQKCQVSQTLTDVTSNFSPTQVDKGSELEIKLTTADNLHVFLTGDVTVTMGGTDITSTAWNESTGKVTIAEVTDDVVITAKSSTYVHSGLAFQLDGLNRGGTAGHWVDRIGNIDFTLAGHTEATDHVQFSGNASGGEAPTSAALDVDELTSTVEVGYEFTDNLAVGSFFNMLRNKTDSKVCAGFMNSTVGNSVYGIQSSSSDGSNPACFINNICANSSTAYKKGCMSMRTKAYTYGQTMAAEDGGYFNGQRMNPSTAGAVMGLADRLMLMKNASQNTAGKLYSIRVYSRRLTDDEILHNYAIDQKRFNIQ